MSLPIKSMLRALKRDLERVALRKLGLFIVERQARLGS